MNRPLYKYVLGAERTDDREYGANESFRIFWDLSENPKTNDREKKLGRRAQGHAVAVLFHDIETARNTYVDGWQKRRITSYFPFEPDNFVPRLHTAGGLGGDDVWALRLIAEHSNAQCERKHRSTMLIDQCEYQTWSFLTDAFWVVNLLAKVTDRELEFNGAGFLAMFLGGDDAQADAQGPTPAGAFAGAQSGSSLGVTSFFRNVKLPAKKKPPYPTVSTKVDKILGATAFNINLRGGFMTDGQDIAQLWHVLHLSGAATGETDKPGSTTSDSFPPAGPGSTAATASKGGGARCAPNKRKFGTLRGDVVYDMGGRIVSHATKPPPEEPQDPDGEIRIVRPFIDSPKKWGVKIIGPANSLQEDSKSCQPTLPRQTKDALLGWVRVPSASMISSIASTVASVVASTATATWATANDSDCPPKEQDPPEDSGGSSPAVSTDPGSGTTTSAGANNPAPNAGTVDATDPNPPGPPIDPPVTKPDTQEPDWVSEQYGPPGPPKKKYLKPGEEFAQPP